MFTGIVDHCGRILRLDTEQNGLRVEISSNFTDLVAGESVAADGICLTVDTLTAAGWQAVLSPETLRRTIAGHWYTGAPIHLERALRPCDRLSGHFVTGHIDQIAQISGRQAQQAFTTLRISGVTGQSWSWLVKKGSIALNGVSLTINEVTSDGFEVMLVPHTLQRTYLNQLQHGDAVNLEFDLLAKFVANHLIQQQQVTSC